jgi:hypothetical protein
MLNSFKHYVLKAYEGVDVYSHIFLTSTLVGEWSASFPGRFTPEEKAHRYPLDRGGRMGPRGGLDDVEKRKFLTLPELERRPLGCPAGSFNCI